MCQGQYPTAAKVIIDETDVCNGAVDENGVLLFDNDISLHYDMKYTIQVILSNKAGEFEVVSFSTCKLFKFTYKVPQKGYMTEHMHPYLCHYSWHYIYVCLSPYRTVTVNLPSKSCMFEQS